MAFTAPNLVMKRSVASGSFTSNAFSHVCFLQSSPTIPCRAAAGIRRRRPLSRVRARDPARQGCCARLRRWLRHPLTREDNHSGNPSGALGMRVVPANYGGVARAGRRHWDVGHLHEFSLSNGRRIGMADADEAIAGRMPRWLGREDQQTDSSVAKVCGRPAVSSRCASSLTLRRLRKPGATRAHPSARGARGPRS